MSSIRELSEPQLLVNTELILQTSKYIEENLQDWDQNHAHFCFVGQALKLHRDVKYTGYNSIVTIDDGADALGLTQKQTNALYYYATNDWQAMKNKIEIVTGVKLDA